MCATRWEFSGSFRAGLGVPLNIPSQDALGDARDSRQIGAADGQRRPNAESRSFRSISSMRVTKASISAHSTSTLQPELPLACTRSSASRSSMASVREIDTCADTFGSLCPGGITIRISTISTLRRVPCSPTPARTLGVRSYLSRREPASYRTGTSTEIVRFPTTRTCSPVAVRECASGPLAGPRKQLTAREPERRTGAVRPAVHDRVLFPIPIVARGQWRTLPSLDHRSRWGLLALGDTPERERPLARHRNNST